MALLTRRLAIALTLAGLAVSGALHAPAPVRAAAAPAPVSPGAPAATSPAPATIRTTVSLLGRSEQGRAIEVIHTGDAAGPHVLVVGCIHGNETAGIPVARLLGHMHTRADLWIVPVLNPDGVAHGTRQDARGVDLNANWSSGWERGGVAFDPYYGGSHPFSEIETRLARALIERIHPLLTVWYHQHQDVIWSYGPSTAAGRLYARAVGMTFYHHRWLPGTATNWQNHHLAGTSAITVELPAGPLSASAVARHARAVLSVAQALSRRG